jgi:glycosyltransferase involved in cell wall biosynthesis
VSDFAVDMVEKMPIGSVSAVVATKDRAPLVTDKVRWLLRRPEVGEVVVVADGCTDDTAERVLAIGDDRVKLIQHDEPLGPAQARLIGVHHSHLPWVSLLDDDDQHPDDFLVRLWEVACAADADIVGAPWFVAPCDGDISAEVAKRRARSATPKLDDVGRFPAGSWTETPFLPMNVLVRRPVFTDVTYDIGYRVNFWREETDFFCSARAAGYRVVLASTTYSWLPGRSDGGIARSASLRYEWWAARNNWRFLRRHEPALRDLGAINEVRVAQIAFVLGRLRRKAKGAMTLRVRRFVTRGVR